MKIYKKDNIYFKTEQEILQKCLDYLNEDRLSKQEFYKDHLIMSKIYNKKKGNKVILIYYYRSDKWDIKYGFSQVSTSYREIEL